MVYYGPGDFSHDSHHMSSENGLALHVLEAEFTDVEAT